VTAFVLWLLQRRYRLIILAIAVAPMIPLLSAALMTLETLRRGPNQGLLSAAFGLAGVLVLGGVVGTDLSVLAPVGGLTMLSGTALGSIIGWTQSLTLAFQASLLVCVLGVVAALLVWPDPGALIGPRLDSLLAVLEGNGASPEQLEALAQLGGVFFGLLAAAIFAQVVVAAILGYWWASLAGTEGQPGSDFRSLRLGKLLGIPATLLMASSLLLSTPVVQNLFPVALFGFCFQGLAVTHAWAHAKRWNPAILLLVYLLLVSPLTAVMILVLGSMGLTDNWINLRAPLRPVA
jgi:hypothetical protein